ncbi:helicase-related protein [Brevibacterium litoralis]|uniref:helicase-related protein n=1 Tax=Brevibacterium litoralis TaxID=3138935 RepID=UPI0032EAB61E
MIDYVGSVENAARVVASLHHGEKRLVFCESRKTAEALTYALRERGVETFVSHSSLSKDERLKSEQAFAESSNTVIVATSTLELGVDIGDLDRVIQLDAPRTVSSFLQRLGRTGRRSGTRRNTLFLATNLASLVQTVALVRLWKSGFVEDVVPPPHPRHLAAQQLLALALQEGWFDGDRWRSWWGDLPVMDDAAEVLEHLRAEGFLVEDSGRLMLGPAAEEAFGRRHFMDLLSSFIAAPELRVLNGDTEVGFISPLALPRNTDDGSKSEREPVLVLAGRGWTIDHVDWDRFRVRVTEVPLRGKVRWPSGQIALSYEMCQARRDVFLGADPDVPCSRRVASALERARDENEHAVSPRGMVLERGSDSEEEDATKPQRLWTWAGLNANATLAAVLGIPQSRPSNDSIVVPPDFTAAVLKTVTVPDDAAPDVPPEAVRALKFSEALPIDLATLTLAQRMADPGHAEVTRVKPVVSRSRHARLPETGITP